MRHRVISTRQNIAARFVPITIYFCVVLAGCFTVGNRILLAAERHADLAGIKESNSIEMNKAVAGEGDEHAAHEAGREARGEAHAGEGEKHEEGHEGGLHLPNFLNILNYAFKGKDSGLFAFLIKHQDTFFSYLVVAFLCLIVIFSSRKYCKVPSGFQGLLELFVKSFRDFSISVIGERFGPGFTAYVGTIFIYILCLNFIGLLPLMKSPIAFNINMPLALALCTLALVQYHGVKQNGLKNYFIHFVGEPWWLFPLNIPLHIMGEYLIKPLSLTLRLTFNITSEDAVIAIIIGFTSAFLLPLHAVFFPLAILFSLIQAFVFTILSAIYLTLMSPHEEHH